MTYMSLYNFVEKNTIYKLNKIFSLFSLSHCLCYSTWYQSTGSTIENRGLVS